MNSVKILVACALIAAAAPSAAAADEIASATIAQPSAPTTITRCLVSTYYSVFSSAFNIYNRASHALIDASIEYRFFDRDNTQIGTVAYTYTPGETLSPQDTGTFNNNTVAVNLAEPMSAVSRVTCRLTGAHFTGRLTWKPGVAWQGGRLSPTPKVESNGEDASIAAALQGPNSRPMMNHKPTSFKFDVEKAWNDAAQSGIFVHDALIVHGGNNGVTIRPADFVLTMALANGGQKMYPGMANGAATYQKYNAFTKEYSTAYQIDPKTDLGQLGSLIVPAHADVNVIVTFAVSDQVADITANRQVSLR